MTGRVKVVFASLLKPVDEPRMYDKLARSLAQTNKYDINIIGFKSKNIPADPSIRFWPIFDFPRISTGRLLAPLKFFRKLLQLKPDLIILTSADFLVVSSLYKILFGTPLIYDVQENYYRNIIWSHGTPFLARKLRASLIRQKEKLSDRMIIQYILAERCYSTECSFINKPYLVLENKARKPESASYQKPTAGQDLHILYGGTIAESYGVLDALKMAEKIFALHPAFRFVICGHCPSQQLYDTLHSLALGKAWLLLKISVTPLPHQEILHQLSQAHFTFVSYRLNPSNEHCMPTRIWEALAWKTPMILKQEHPWVDLVEEYQAGFAIDFDQPDPQLLLHRLLEQTYFSKPLPGNIYWESQQEEWIRLVDKIIKEKYPDTDKP